MDPRDRITQARIQLRKRFPFYGALAMSLQPVETDMLDDGPLTTMATDGDRLYYHAPFVAELSPPCLEFVCAHEALHCALKHTGVKGFRRRDGRMPKEWNDALDFAINGILVKSGMTMPQRNGKPFGLYDQRYDGMVAEAIYEDLLRRQAAGDYPETPPFDNHCFIIRPAKDKADRDQQRRKWQGRIIHAETVAKKANADISGLYEIIKKMVEPAIDFESELASFCQQSCGGDAEVSFPPNRRHLWQEMFLPSRGGLHILVYLMIDSSGSMSSRELQYGLGCVKRIMADFDSFEIHLVTFSNGVHDYTVLRTGDAFPDDFKFTERGGTLFRPALAWPDTHHLKPDVGLLFTDGYPCDEWPDTLSYPLMTILTQPSGAQEPPRPPLGRSLILSIDDDDY